VTRSRTFTLAALVIAATLALSLAVSQLTVSQSVRAGGIGTLPTTPHWWQLWSVPPVEVSLIGLLAIAIFPRARSGWPRWSAIAGIVVLLGAVCSPISGMAKDGLLEIHMAQHTLIGGFGALLIVAALPRARQTAPGLLRLVAHPGVGLPLWMASSAIWLFPSIHGQLLDSELVWILQQISFFVFGFLVWCPVLERVSTAPAWFGTGAKCAYMTAVWFFGLGIANLFWFSGTPLYPGHAALDTAWGIGALQDQANAGTVMMVTHCILAFGTIGVLFFANARERSIEQRLLEAGYDPTQVRAAVRSGQISQFADARGVSTVSRPGID